VSPIELDTLGLDKNMPVYFYGV